MSNAPLRRKLIRLAHEKPELRRDILPLLKEGGDLSHRTLGLHWLIESEKWYRQFWLELARLASQDTGLDWLGGGQDSSGGCTVYSPTQKATVRIGLSLTDYDPGHEKGEFQITRTTPGPRKVLKTFPLQHGVQNPSTEWKYLKYHGILDLV